MTMIALWRSRYQQTTDLLRLTPYDTSTPEGRSKERYRRVALSAATSVGAKGVTLLTTLISVPLTVNYLGTERFGLWMTISSVITLLGFADLGIGNGLLNAISEANGKDDRELASKSVSSGFFILSGIGLLIFALFALSYPFVPWPRVFNVTSHLASQEAGPALAVFVACFALSIPLGIVQRVQLGYQEGYATNLWQSLGGLLGLGGVLLVIHFRGGLTWLVLAMAGAPVLSTALNWIIHFARVRPWLLPEWKGFQAGVAQRLLATGIVFLVLQVMTLVASATDNLVIAQTIGSPAVAGYAVVQRIFSVVLLSQTFVTPLWPAFGEAMARSDHVWARRTLSRALLISLSISTALGLILLLLGQQIVSAWVGPELVPSVSLLLGYFLWTEIGTYGGVMSTFLNSGEFVGRQVVFFSAASITALVLKIILAHVWLVPGVVWASVIGFSLFYVPPSASLARRVLRWSKSPAPQ